MATGDVILNGTDRAFTLNFGVNAMCRLEALAGRSYHAVLAELRAPQPPMTLVRMVMRAALTDPPSPPDEEAGDILQDLGGPHVVILAFVASCAEFDEIGRQIAEAQPHG